MLFVNLFLIILACAISFALGAKYANYTALKRGYVIYKDKWYQISKIRW